MGRTKQTTRKKLKILKDPHYNPNKEKTTKKVPDKKTKKDEVKEAPPKARKEVVRGKKIDKKKTKKLRFVRRKFSQQATCLKKIRRAQQALDLAILRIPFQIFCKQIADVYAIKYLGHITALAYFLQKAAKDFMIEILDDSYIFGNP